MMTIKLRKVGNSIGVILPKTIIKDFNLKEGDSLEVVEEKDGFKLIAYDSEFAEWAEAYKKIHTNYKNALQQLAK